MFKLFKKNKNKKGFSLIELLGVVVVLGLLVMIAVPFVSKYIQSSKDKVFITNIGSVVNKIKETSSIENVNYCVFSDIQNDLGELKADNIKALDIIVYLDNSKKKKFAVNAVSADEKTYIMALDFDKIVTSSKEKWDDDSIEVGKLALQLLFDENSVVAEDIEKCDAVMEEIK